MNGVVLAQILVNIAGLYLALGLIFAIIFIVWGAERIDPGTRQATMGFRLIIMPGVMLLWPVVAQLWRRRALHRPVQPHAQHDTT